MQRGESSTANWGISHGFSYTVTVQVRLFFENLNFHIKHIPSHCSCGRVWKDHTNILWRFEKAKEIRSFPVVGGLLQFSIKNMSWMEGVVVLNNLLWLIFFNPLWWILLDVLSKIGVNITCMNHKDKIFLPKHAITNDCVVLTEM